jgi:hypothetical protein
MAVQWIACPFVRRDPDPVNQPWRHGVHMLIQDFTTQIAADNPGRTDKAWDYFECGGGPGTDYLCGVAVAKIRASDATLSAILAASPRARSFGGLVNLSDPLPNGQQAQNSLRNIVSALGYTTAELDAWVAAPPTGFNNKTLGDLHNLLASRWYRRVFEPTGTQPTDSSYQGIAYPGILACDGRTTSEGVVSEPWLPLPKTPAQVAAAVSNT